MGCIYAMNESGAKDLCPFCRAPGFDEGFNEEEEMKRINILMEKGNADAFYQHASYYREGSMGLPQDEAKVIELYLKAGELGCALGYYNLGQIYHIGDGVDIDKKKAKHYYELAAMDGSVYARYNLGIIEVQNGNYHKAMKHFVLAARAGDDDSLGAVKKGYMNEIVTKDEHANTLREYQKSQNEMRSDTRDKAAAVLAEDRVMREAQL